MRDDGTGMNVRKSDSEGISFKMHDPNDLHQMTNWQLFVNQGKGSDEREKESQEKMPLRITRKDTHTRTDEICRDWIQSF